MNSQPGWTEMKQTLLTVTPQIDTIYFCDYGSDRLSKCSKQSQTHESKLETHVNTHEITRTSQLSTIKISSVKQERKEASACVLSSYNIWDLTNTLATLQISTKWLISLFLVQVLIRYYTFACLVYVIVYTHSQRWRWVFTILITYVIYVIAIVKISLRVPETQSEIVLKSVFNSLESVSEEYFQFIKKSKLIRSILKALIPPELSLLYIKQSRKRRLQIYAMINYIFSSIESIVYYPFFIIYCLLITSDNNFLLDNYYKNLTVVIAAAAWVSFIAFSFYLLIEGIRRKRRAIF